MPLARPAPRTPVATWVLSILGALLVLRNVPFLLEALRRGYVPRMPAILAIVGIAMLWSAYRGWKAARVNPVQRRAPATSPVAASSDEPARGGAVAPLPPTPPLPPGTLVPYFVTDAVAAARDQKLQEVGRPPQGAEGLITVAPGLYLTVAEDVSAQVRPLFAEDIADKGVTLAAALAASRSIVGRMLGTSELPVRTYDVTPYAVPAVWQPGLHAIVRDAATVKVVVVGPGWMAASTAATSELYTHCLQVLGTTELRMVLPHRDRIFVFADAGDFHNEQLANGIVRAETDFAQKPLSAQVLRLSAGGFGATRDGAGGSDFERGVFALAAGTPRAELEATLSSDTAWKWDDAKQSLGGRPAELDGWILGYEFTPGGLRALRMTYFFQGTWEMFADLDAEMRALLPSLDLREHANPWRIENARTRLENKGTAQMKMGAMFTAESPGRGELVGKALAFDWEGKQHYGYELTWLPAS